MQMLISGVVSFFCAALCLPAVILGTDTLLPNGVSISTVSGIAGLAMALLSFYCVFEAKKQLS